MRILHVIGTLDPSTGGPPRVATRLAAGQARSGHDVTIAAYGTTEREAFAQMTRLLPAFDRVRIAALPRGGPMESVLGSRSRPTLRELVDQADVVHIHNVWESVNRVAAVEARRAGKPYLIQPNDMLNVYSLGQKRWKKKLAIALGYRRMIEGAYGLLFGHEQECQLVRRTGFRTNHFVAPLGGVFQEEVEPRPATGLFYQRCPQLGGRPFIVFLSRLHPKKGLDHLAEGFALAAPRFPDVQLVVIGHDEGAQPDFEQRIARHGLTERVHLVGPMHGQAKWEAYRDARCFVLPSRDEAFTVAITEALASGLPVVISANCHYDDVAEYGAGVIVDLTPQGVAEGLGIVLSDPARREQMSQAARKLFRERLSFDEATQRTLAIYEQALRQTRGDRAPA